MRWFCIPLLLAIIQSSHLCSETDKVNKNLPLPPWTLFPLWTLIMSMNTQSYICMLYDSMHMYVYMCAHMYAYTCMAAGTVIMQMLSLSWHPLHWGNTLQWFTFSQCLTEELEAKPRWWIWDHSLIQLWQVLLAGGDSLVHIKRRRKPKLKCIWPHLFPISSVLSSFTSQLRNWLLYSGLVFFPSDHGV